MAKEKLCFILQYQQRVTKRLFFLFYLYIFINFKTMRPREDKATSEGMSLLDGLKQMNK